MTLQMILQDNHPMGLEHSNEGLLRNLNEVNKLTIVFFLCMWRKAQHLAQEIWGPLSVRISAALASSCHLKLWASLMVCRGP